MKLFLIDFESTGLDINTTRILEHGHIVWDTDFKKPSAMGSCIWYDDSYPKEWKEAEKINGISPEYAKKFGLDPKKLITSMEDTLVTQEIDYFVAHNGKAYDLPLLRSEVKRHNLECPKIMSLPIIDTRYDLPFYSTPKSRHLGHLAYDYGIVHDPEEKHAALFDCLLMLGLLKKFDVDKIIKCFNSPTIIIKANVTRENKDLAKFNGFSWNPEKVAWLRSIKEYELTTEQERCTKLGFEISVC